MKTRAVTDSNDWTFGKGEQNYRTNIDALKQRLKTRLFSWTGDCFFQTEEGIDWINYFDIGMKSFMDRDIKRTILQTDGVLQIADFQSTMDKESRNVTVQATILSIYGDLQFIETVSVGG